MFIGESYNVYDPLMMRKDEAVRWENYKQFAVEHHKLYELFMMKNYDTDVYLM